MTEFKIQGWRTPSGLTLTLPSPFEGEGFMVTDFAQLTAELHTTRMTMPPCNCQVILSYCSGVITYCIGLCVQKASMLRAATPESMRSKTSPPLPTQWG